MPQPPPRAFAYIRFSTDEQRKGQSLERQVASVRAFAESHALGPVDTESFQDLGVSAFRGANDTKGALGEFLAQIARGEIGGGDWLLVENLDRLSRRSLEEAFTLLTSITSAGVTVATVQDGQVYQQHGFDFATFMRAGLAHELAHQESKKKSERLCAAWASKRAKLTDRKLTARCPGWLSLSPDKKTFSIIEGRAAVVRRIFKETANGRGPQYIAKVLNAEKVPVWKTGTGWAGTTVAGVIAARAVLGEFTPCKMEGRKRMPVGEPIPDYYPRVISDGDFYAAQSVSKGRLNKGGHSITSTKSLFTGICFCSQCSGPIHYADKSRGVSYLRCDHAVRGLSNCSPSHRPYGPIENAFIHWLVNFDFTGATMGERKQKETELAAGEEATNESGRKVERLTEAMATSSLPVSTFLPQLERAKAEHDRLASACATLRASLNHFRDGAPTIDAQKMAKKPEHRFRLREEIRRRVKRMVMFPNFVRVELPNGDTCDVRNEKTMELNTRIGNRKGRTRLIFSAA